jgi:hypothetical protein
MILDLSVPVSSIVELDPSLTDRDHFLKVFIGYKSSNQALHETTVTSCGKEETGYRSDTLAFAIEGFACGNVKCEAEKKRKSAVHTPYRNVFEFNQSVCGVYDDLVTFRDGQIHEVRFQINIPVTYMLCFSFLSYLSKFPSLLPISH